jgi:molybdopterin molybdotransferase
MPSGADAVVMQEDVQVGPEEGMVWFSEPVKPWENIRFRGEDIRAGVTLLEAGVRLRPSHAGLAAAAGLAAVEVFRRPLVWVAATGNELLEPGEPARPGAIHESNRAGIAALAEEAGARVRVFPILPDDPEATTQFFREAAAEADFVLTSGGVSVGELDYVKEAFGKAGGAIELWRVLMKPGKPFAWGRAGRTLWFGLPGNPVSALVTFLVLVRPAILAAQGAAERLLPERAGSLGAPVVNRGPRRNFMRVAIDAEGVVQPSAGQASHMLSAFTSANALLEIPPETRWPAGAPVKVALLPGA